MDNINTIAASVVNICAFTGPSVQIESRLRWSDVHQFIIVTGGHYTATTDCRGTLETVSATTGNVVLWPCGVERTDKSVRGNRLHSILVWIKCADLDGNLPYVVADNDQVITTLARRLLMLVNEPNRSKTESAGIDALASAMLAEYILQSASHSNTIVAKTALYIEQNIDRKLTLEELARFVGMSKHHFGRKYKQLTGRTPMHDVMYRKAIYARNSLWLTPSRPLQSVADSIGVKDEATLVRLFNRYVGAKVREIRKSAKKS